MRSGVRGVSDFRDGYSMVCSGSGVGRGEREARYLEGETVVVDAWRRLQPVSDAGRCGGLAGLIHSRAHTSRLVRGRMICGVN